MQGINIPIAPPSVRTLFDVLSQKKQEQSTQALQGAQTGFLQEKIRQMQAPQQQPDQFQTADTAHLLEDMNKINQKAADTKEEDIPLFNQLKAAVENVPLGTGPIRGQILWATPQGQYLKSLLTRAQGKYIKNFHLGRMTQREFDLLRSAVGGGTTYSSGLKAIFNRQLAQSNQDLAKQQFYNQYINQGGRSSLEAANKWLKTVGEKPLYKPFTKKEPIKEARPEEDISKMSPTELRKIAAGGG